MRLRQVEAWRAGWGPALADAPKGADGQAWVLAWGLALAPATGAAVAGVATDLPKCYDGARLPLLRRPLASAGWPSGLVAPAPPPAAFGSVTLLGSLPCLRPASRPGAPLAVSVLAVLTWPWQEAVALAGATAARRYVDDLTACLLYTSDAADE